MAYPYNDRRKTYRTSKKEVEEYNDFSGGYVTDVELDAMADNQLVKAENVDLDMRGAVKKRKGTVPLNEVAYSSEITRLIKWSKKDGSVVYIGLIGTSLRILNQDSEWAESTILKTLDSTDFGYFIHNDKFYFTGQESNTDKYWVYDGSTTAEVAAYSDASNDLGPIKRCRKFVWNPQNLRIYAIGDRNDKSALYYSEANDPTYFKATSKLYPTTGDGPAIGVTSFGKGVLALYQNSIWAWGGVDPASDATWKKLPLTHGTISAGTVCLTPSSLTMLGVAGIYSLSPAIFDEDWMLIAGSQLSVNLAQDKVVSLLINELTHVSTAISTYDIVNNRYLMAYGDDSSNPKNNKILVYHWNTQCFSIYTGIQVSDFCLNEKGEVLIASGKYVLKLGEGLNDWDVDKAEYKPIKFKMWSKELSLGYSLQTKKYKSVIVAVQQFSEAETIADVGIMAGNKSLLYSDVAFNESFVWGDPWGAIWGWINYTDREFRCRLKARRIQVRIEQDLLDQDIIIYGIGFIFTVKKAKGVKVNVNPEKNVLS